MKLLRLDRIALLTVATAVPVYAFACSSSDEAAPTSPTSTTPTTTPTSDAGDAGADPCADIASACHPYDLGAGSPQHECHEASESAKTPAECEAKKAECLAACSAASGPLQVNMVFGGYVGDEALECGKKYPGIGAESSTTQLVDLRFYVSDWKLIDEAGKEVPVTITPDGKFQSADVALVDLENKAGACSNGTTETHEALKGTVPFAKYKGVTFTIGVPEKLNHTDVATAPSPVNLTALNWGWQSGRIFFASGFRSDANDAGTTNDSFVHVGSTGCTGDPADGGTVTCTNSNRAVVKFDAIRFGEQVIAIDVKELLKDQKLVSVANGCHSMPAENCTKAFDHLGIDYATGKPSATQTVFSLKKVAEEGADAGQ